MATFTALTTLKRRDQAAALGEAMERLLPEPTGVGLTEVKDGSDVWEVSGYFVETPDETALAVLAAAFSALPFAVLELPETDWVAHVRRALAPIRAGRFFLYGSHDADKVPADVVAMKIDAAMAFGTGHHGTTRGCLEALDALLSEGFSARKVADIGCGTAVLAMAAAKVWPAASVLASDIDEVAVETARSNLEVNDLAGKITCVTAAGFQDGSIKQNAPFDLIFANILKAPLIFLAPDMGLNASAGGFVILSGILTPQADEVVAAYLFHGMSLVRQLDLGEWSTLTLIKAP